MKKNIIALTLILAVAITQTGCMCVHIVNTAGRQRRELKATAVWTNMNNNIAVECEMVDTSRLSQNTKSLGTRFVYASRDTWDKSISDNFQQREDYARRRGETNQVSRLYLDIEVSLLATNSAKVTEGGFALFPSDFSTRSEESPLGNTWQRSDNSPTTGMPRFTTRVSNQLVTIYIRNVVLPRDAQRYKRWWWYPNQIMLIPAYAVDIVTAPVVFPVVYLIAMNSLGDIS